MCTVRYTCLTIPINLILLNELFQTDLTQKRKKLISSTNMILYFFTLKYELNIFEIF